MRQLGHQGIAFAISEQVNAEGRGHEVEAVGGDGYEKQSAHGAPGAVGVELEPRFERRLPEGSARGNEMLMGSIVRPGLPNP